MGVGRARVAPGVFDGYVCIVDDAVALLACKDHMCVAELSESRLKNPRSSVGDETSDSELSNLYKG